MTSYGSSTVSRRRRTKAELTEVDDAIIAAVAEEHPVTLRGVYYRVVSAGVVEKTELGYRLVGRRLLELRRNRKVPYSHVTDGTRWVTRPTTFTDLDQMLDDAAASYRRALWHQQDDEVQIFTEKDAISGVILPITQQWDVPLGVIRGYCSESFAHNVAASIINSNVSRSGTTYLYQLGDADPSGVDAWRDFTEKVSAFITEATAAELDLMQFVRFERLAVTEEQIDEWQLPTRPTKKSDSRAKKFTGRSVEVDAIPAPMLRRLVEDVITEHMDQEQLRITQHVEQEERDIFARMVARKREEVA
ncbi:MAG: hypothetical protein ACRDQA_02540 [Nocardioidaceae bacterium]